MPSKVILVLSLIAVVGGAFYYDRRKNTKVSCRRLLTAESSHPLFFPMENDLNLTRPPRPTRRLGTRLADLQLPFADTSTFCGLVKGVVVVGMRGSNISDGFQNDSLQDALESLHWRINA